MTQQRSENKNYALKYFTYQLGRLKSCIIFSTIFSFLFFPMMMVSKSRAVSISVETAAIILSIISFVGLVAVTFIAPLTAMKHLYTKTSADNILSLPLTAGQRFIGDICAGFGAFAVPFALSIPVTYIVRKSADAHMDFSIVFLAFALLLMFAAFNTMLTICCGRLTEAILYPIALNFAVPLFTILGTYISYVNAFGLDSGNMLSTTGFLQALMGFLGYVIAVTSPVGCYFEATVFELPVPIIIALIMTAIMLVIAFVLYKKRPAHRIGQPFVFRPVFTISAALVILGAITTYIALMFILNGGETPDFAVNGAVAAVIALILLLIMELINYKRIKNALKFIIKYAAMTIGGLALCFILYKGEGFGIAAYIPEESDIEYVKIYQYNMNGTSSAVVKGNTDSSKMITELHKNKIDNRSASNGMGDDTIYIEYYLRNGQYVSRCYAGEPDSFWEEMYATEGYRLDKLNTLKMYAKQDLTLAISDVSSSEELKYAFALENEHNGNIKYIFIEEADMEALTAALEADLSADESYGRHKDAAIGTLRIANVTLENSINVSEKQLYHTITRINIYESYTNTCAYLSRFGTLPTAGGAATDAVKSSPTRSVMRVPKDKNSWIEQDSEMILVYESEFKELLANEVMYTKQNDSEYIYYLVLGVDNRFSPVISYDYHNYEYSEEQLENFRCADLLQPEVVFDEYYISSVCDVDTSGDKNIYALINEEMYEELDEMFKQRYVITCMK